MVLSGFKEKITLISTGFLFLLLSCTTRDFNVISPVGKLPPAAKCSAIYPLRNLSSVPGAGVVVSQVFYDEMSSRKGWHVINWDTVVRLKEAKVHVFTSPPTNEQLAKFGKKIGVGSVLYGSVLNFSYRYTGTGVLVPVVSFSIKLIDTTTGRVEWTGLTSVIGNLTDSLVTLTRRVVKEMLTDLEKRIEKGDYKCPAENEIWTLVKIRKLFEKQGKNIKKYGKVAEKILSLINTRDRFILDGVHFEGRSEKLASASYSILDALGEILADNPSIRLRIECHTDSSGNPAVDKEITNKQAKVILQYLVSKFNISPNRLQVVGEGSDYPLLPNVSRRNRQLNRRIEIVVLSR